MKGLGIISTYEEWLEEYISWQDSKDDTPTARMTRREYYRRYFPKDFNTRDCYERHEKVKAELMEKGDVFFNSCNEHGYYNSKDNLLCPKCSHNTSNDQ